MLALKEKIFKIEERFPLFVNDKMRDALFFTSLMIIVFIDTITSTMFPLYLTFYSYLRCIALILLLAKLALFDSWNVRKIVLFGIYSITAILISYTTGQNDILWWTLLLWGARDIPFDKILKVHFFEVLIIVVCAVCASLLGLIENLRYPRSSGGVRNSFGIVYATDFAAFVFFLLASFFYLYREKIKWWIYSIGLVISFVVYKLCYTRLDCASMAILSILFMICSLIKPYVKNRLKLLRTLLCFSILIFFAISLVFTLIYNPENALLSKIDSLFSGRLNLGKIGFEEYPVNLFGHFIKMVGAGKSTEYRSDYFFLDSSYIYCFLSYGVVFIVILIMTYIAICYKRREDLFFLVVIFVIALNSTTAHHLTHIQYNPFFMALFASFIKEPKEKAC